MRGNMRDVEDMARYVLDMFLNTKFLKAMGLTLDRQRVYLGFKIIRCQRIKKFRYGAVALKIRAKTMHAKI